MVKLYQLKIDILGLTPFHFQKSIPYLKKKKSRFQKSILLKKKQKKVLKKPKKTSHLRQLPLHY